MEWEDFVLVKNSIRESSSSSENSDSNSNSGKLSNDNDTILSKENSNNEVIIIEEKSTPVLSDEDIEELITEQITPQIVQHLNHEIAKYAESYSSSPSLSSASSSSQSNASSVRHTSQTESVSTQNLEGNIKDGKQEVLELDTSSKSRNIGSNNSSSSISPSASQSLHSQSRSQAQVSEEDWVYRETEGFDDRGSHSYRDRYMNFQSSKFTLVEILDDMKRLKESVEADLKSRLLEQQKEEQKLSISLSIQQRVLEELQSTIESTHIVLQYAEMVLEEKKDDKELVSLSITLIKLISPICRSCIKRCQSLLDIAASEDAPYMYKIVNTSMVQWLLHTPAIRDWMQKTYETVNENKPFWFLFLGAAAAALGLISAHTSSNNKVGVAACLALLAGMTGVYHLGKEASVLKNPKLIYQLSKLRDIISKIDRNETHTTMKQLIEALSLSMKVAEQYGEFVERSKQECAICYTALYTTNIGRPNTCNNHWFHFQELQDWAMKGNKNCPICRKPFDYVEEILKP